MRNQRPDGREASNEPFVARHGLRSCLDYKRSVFSISLDDRRAFDETSRETAFKGRAFQVGIFGENKYLRIAAKARCKSRPDFTSAVP